MLQAIRNRAQGVFAWVILILISVPFALWGIQNYVSTGAEEPIASVGDKEFFQRDVNRGYQQFQQSPYGRSQINEEEIKRQILNKLIEDEILAQNIDQIDMVVSDDVVRQHIKSIQYFQSDGEFDRDKYELILSSQGNSSTQFSEQVRKAFVMEQFKRGVVDTSFVTQAELERFFKIQNQERKMEYIVIPIAEKESEIPSDEVEKYYNEHAESFAIPERVSIEYLELSLDNLANKVNPSEDELALYYEENKDSYTSEGRRKVSHILFKLNTDADEDTTERVRNKAEKARQRIMKGEDFAVVAQEMSDDPVSAKKGGDLGLIRKGEMVKSFEDAAFALSQGEISKTIKTGFGFHLIKVTELDAAQTKPFEEIQQELAKAYQRNQVENQFYEMGETLAELVYENPDRLDVAAHTLGLSLTGSELFTIEAGEGIASNNAIRTAAFSNDVLAGNNSEPIELGADKVVVLRVKEHIAVKTKSIDEVRADIVIELREEGAKRKTKDLAESIYEQLKKGNSLSELAESNHLKSELPKFIKRHDQQLPRQLQQAIFKAEKPQKGQRIPILVALLNGEQAVAVLLQVRDADLSTMNQQASKTVEIQLKGRKGQSTLSALLIELQNKADVSIRGRTE